MPATWGIGRAPSHGSSVAPSLAVPSPYAIACNLPFGSRRGLVGRGQTVGRNVDNVRELNLHLDLSFVVTP